MDCYEMGDVLHGAKIYAEARKIENAHAVIIQRLRWIPEQ